MKKKISDIFVIVILFIITFLICMKSPTNIFSGVVPSYTDSSVFKHMGWSMTQGSIPYRDFFDHKGVLLYFINYLGFLISQTIGVWLIEFIFMFTSVLFAYKLARKFTYKAIALLIIGIAFAQIYSYFEGGNLTEEYALPFQLIALNIFFDFFLNPQKYSSERNKGILPKIKFNFSLFNIPVFICGICCAAVIFLRINMISVWFAFGLMVLIYCIFNKKYKELIKFIISFGCGLLIVTIPIIIYLLKNNAFDSFINSYILFNMTYSSNNEKITKIDTLVFFFNTVITRLAVIIVIVKIYMQVKNKEKYYFNLGYLFYMIMTLILISMSGNQFGHYGMTIIPMLIYPYCLMYQFLEKEELKSIGIEVIITTYFLYSIIIPTGLQFATDCLRTIKNRYSPHYTNEVIEYIRNNTEEEDFISVFGNNDYIYYLANRQSVSKYSYQTPIGMINKDFMNEYLNDLKEKKPKLIIWTIGDGYVEMIEIMKTFLEDNNYKLVLDGGMPIYAMNGE